MSETIRAFIAIELPEKIIVSIGRVQEMMRSYGFKVRWVPPRNMHLTLKFLDDISKAQIEAVGQAISASVNDFAPMSMVAKGLGAFPGIKQPRVLWLGVGGQLNELIRLQQELDEQLAGIGFAKEKRTFKGHLTLGRVKGKIDPKKLLEAIQEVGGFETEPFVADKIILFKSDLKPTGAVYTKLMEADLAHE